MTFSFVVKLAPSCFVLLSEFTNSSGGDDRIWSKSNLMKRLGLPIKPKNIPASLKFNFTVSPSFNIKTTLKHVWLYFVRRTKSHELSNYLKYPRKIIPKSSHLNYTCRIFLPKSIPRTNII